MSKRCLNVVVGGVIFGFERPFSTFWLVTGKKKLLETKKTHEQTTESKQDERNDHGGPSRTCCGRCNDPERERDNAAVSVHLGSKNSLFCRPRR